MIGIIDIRLCIILKSAVLWFPAVVFLNGWKLLRWSPLKCHIKPIQLQKHNVGIFKDWSISSV